MKRLIAFGTAFLLLAYIAIINVSAHNFSKGSGYYHHLAVTHWDVYENNEHWGSYSTKMTVSCGDFVGTTFETNIKNAVTKWDSAKFNNSDLMTMEIDNKKGCVIFLSKTPEEMLDYALKTTWAVTVQTEADSDATYHHYKTTSGNVEIWVNWDEVVSTKSSNAKNHVPLHELGHVIGLIDVPSSVSGNGHIMCNDFGTAYTPPTTISTEDLQGAAFIMGQHSSHTLQAKYIYHNPTYHRQCCSICGAYLLTKHTYSNNKCTLCGTAKSFTASEFDYEEYSVLDEDNVEPEFKTENTPPYEFDFENEMLYSYDIPFIPDED